MPSHHKNPDAQDEIYAFAQEMVNKISGKIDAYGAGDHQVTLRLDQHLVAQIDSAARFCGISRTQLMARLIYDGFEDFDAAMLHHFRESGLRDKAVEYVEEIHGANFGDPTESLEEIEDRKDAWFDQDGPKGD